MCECFDCMISAAPQLKDVIFPRTCVEICRDAQGNNVLLGQGARQVALGPAVTLLCLHFLPPAPPDMPSTPHQHTRHIRNV